MSSICGFLCTVNGRQAEPRLLGAMTDTLAHWGPDAVGRWHDGPVALGHLLLRHTPDTVAEDHPVRDVASGRVLAADVTLYNRDELAEALGIPAAEASAMNDAAFILAAYDRWGEACLDHLLGDFAFALWNPRERSLFCARDHVGVRPFFYHAGRRGFFFASAVRGLLPVHEIPRELHVPTVRCCLVAQEPARDRTAWTHVRRLPPGCCMTVRANGETSLRQYWRPDPHREIRLASDDEYVEAARERLLNAVRRRLRTTGLVASELSGGLDSGGIAAAAAPMLADEGRELLGISHLLPDGANGPDDLDETPEIDAIREFAGIRQWRPVRGDERNAFEIVREGLPRHGELTPSRFGTNGILYHVAREADARVLLSGLGGDHVSTSYPRGAPLGLIAADGEWREVARQARLKGRAAVRDWHRILHGGLTAFSPALSRGVRHASWSLPSIGKKHGRAADILDLVLFSRREFLEALEAARLSAPDTGNPLGVRDQQARRIHELHMGGRLQGGAIDTLAHRMEYRYPLLDVRLLEFVLAVPSSQKAHGATGRYLYRRLMRGILPDSVRLRSVKTVPTAPWHRHVMKRDAPTALEMLHDAPWGNSHVLGMLNRGAIVGKLERIAAEGMRHGAGDRPDCLLCAVRGALAASELEI